MIIEYWTTTGFKRRIVKNQFWNEYVLWNRLHSPDENTPAIIHPLNGIKFYYKNGKKHRLTGPALLWERYSNEEFWLDGKYYKTIKEWINNHPNPDLYFNTIGIFTETDKVIWYLKN
jgi:hypothetical protein